MKLVFSDDLTVDQFLREYWQKKPLLIKRGIPDYQLPLSAEELAGLACEEEIESRIVLEKDGASPWEARIGPFLESDFSALPSSHWTLLVQDVDKHIPEMTELLKPFSFIPSWRLDDIMISYAVDQGSVGPHIDDYDVFLIQTQGTRLWKIGMQPGSHNDHIPGLDLRILPHFEPNCEWLVEPGDVLYLPPNFPHWGIAQGDDCITCSVGYKAPSFPELCTSWSDELIERMSTDRYRDKEINCDQDYGEITSDSINDIHHKMSVMLNADEDLKQRWLGCFITEPKEHLIIDPIDDPVSTDLFVRQMVEKGEVARHGWARMAFIRGNNDQNHLFVQGEAFPIHNDHICLLRLLTEKWHFTVDELSEWLEIDETLDLLTTLYNRGYLLYDHE